jgi:hypothetical protein
VDGHRDLAATKRTIGELLARDLVQNRRVLGDPIDLAVALRGEGRVFDE